MGIRQSCRAENQVVLRRGSVPNRRVCLVQRERRSQVSPSRAEKAQPRGSFYDIYGNALRRHPPTSTTRTTMQTAPRRIRTGPKQAIKLFPLRIQGERFAVIRVDIPSEAKVVTANYDQRIKVSANEGSEIAMKMPFTEGGLAKLSTGRDHARQGRARSQLRARRTSSKRRGHQGVHPHATQVNGSFRKFQNNSKATENTKWIFSSQ